MPDLGLEVLLKGKNAVRLLGGLWVALRISLISVAISIPLGILLGVLMTKKNRLIRAILRIYLEIIRIMPQMVLLFLAYFGTARAFGWNLDGETAAIIVFALWGTAEMSDLVRGALVSIPRHQYESAEALGLTRGQVFRYVVLPQTVRRLLPQSINLITRMIKTTSLILMIGVNFPSSVPPPRACGLHWHTSPRRCTYPLRALQFHAAVLRERLPPPTAARSHPHPAYQSQK